MEVRHVPEELSDREVAERQALKDIFEVAWAAEHEPDVALELLIGKVSDIISDREAVVDESRRLAQPGEYSEDTFKQFMNESARPLLNGRAEEFQLFWVRAVGQAAEERIDAPEHEEHIEQYFYLAQAGQWAFDEILQSNIRLVANVAKSRGVMQRDLLDYMSVGMIGLRKGIEKFDPERATKFSTYARPRIFAEMQRYAAQIKGSYRMPSEMLTDHNAILRARDDLQDLGVDEDSEAVALRTGLSVDRVLEIERTYMRATQTTQLDATVYSESQVTSHDVLADEQAAMFTERVEDFVMVNSLVDLMHDIGLYDEQIKMILHEAGLLGDTEAEEMSALRSRMGGANYQLWLDRARRKLADAGVRDLITGTLPTDTV